MKLSATKVLSFFYTTMTGFTEQLHDIRAKAIEAFQSLRKEAETSMEPEMTLEEINAEINAVRETKG